MKLAITYCSILLLLLATMLMPAHAQFNDLRTDSWQEVQQFKKGTVTCLWYDIEPFIYRSGKGIVGVEYELMEGFKKYLKTHYDVQLEIDWVDAGAFEKIYPFIAASDKKGLFGLSFYSITEERKKEIKFSPPYMPDLNIICSHYNLPTYQSDTAFLRDINRLRGYTMKQTTMYDDLLKLKNDFFPGLSISDEADDYEVLKKIAVSPNSFGYVPLSIYIVAMQRGIKIKRQRVLATRREGFAAIYSKASDWDKPINEYFVSAECKKLTDDLIKRYLGKEVSDIILDVSASDSVNGNASDIELLMKEREVVTQRLIDTALKSQRQEQQRIYYISAIISLLLVGTVLYNRFRIKHSLNRKLRQQNELVALQKLKIEQMNQQLQMKILQSRLNPHFLFNSLNAIQYFVTEADNKATLKYINRFSSFLRNVLKASDDVAVEAGEEARILEQYLWLEQNRFPGKFSFEVTVSKNTETFKLPPLLSISMVENILYRSLLLNKTGGPDHISIYFTIQDSALHITARDNGITMQDSVSRPEKLVQRLTLMNASGNTNTSLSYEAGENENISILQIAEQQNI